MKSDSDFTLKLHNFSIRTRLFSIVLAFAIPLSVLIYSTVENINRNIVVAEMEINGIEYERVLINILATVSNHRLLRIGMANGEDRGDEYRKQSQDIDELLDKLSAIEKRLSGKMHFHYKDIDEVSSMTETLRGNWEDIKKYNADRYEVYGTMFRNINRMIVSAGDVSGLILDPDLDSYYLMDVSVNRLPASIKRISDIAYSIYPTLVFGNEISAELRSEAKVASIFLRETEFDAVMLNIESALEQDKNFYGVSPNLIPSMLPLISEYKQRMTVVIDMLGSIAEGKAVNSKGFSSAIYEIRSFFVKMNNATLNELEAMIRARIKYYEHKQLETLVLYAMAQIIGLLLFLFLTTSVTTPINRLRRTIATITEGNLDVSVPSVNFQDEIGAMARGVESFRLNALEKLRLEVALKEESEYLQSIMDNSGDGIIVVNSKGKVLDFNRSSERIFGYNASSVIGQNISTILSPKFSSDYGGYFESYFLKDSSSVVVTNREIEGKRKSGEVFPIEMALSKLIHGQEVLFVGLLKDITERKKLEDELRQHRDHLQKLVDIQTVDLILEKEKAEQASVAKSEFLSNMSHELRTPMHAILNYANMGIKIVEGEGDSKLNKYLTNIKVAGNRLLGLLNNLLDFEKLEVGKMEFNIREHDFAKVIDYAEMELDSLLKVKKLSVIKKYNTSNTSASFDEAKLIQVLINLLSNAIKFSPEGGVISITVADEYMMEKALVRSALLCSIEDEGGGIPENELEIIFEKFTQSSSAKAKITGGTGLGLSISRKIIEAHGGRIFAENGSKGAILKFILPRG